MRSSMAVLALMAFAVPASAQTTTQQGQAAIDTATRQFVEKVAISDMYEIQAGRIALDKSDNQQIEQFAKTMVDDHTKTSNELKAAVQNMQGLQLPEKVDAAHQQKLDQLKSASAGQFIQEYRTQQIDAHETAVSLFTDYSKNGTQAELKSWAERTLPHLRHHLEMAQNLPRQAPAVAQNQGRDPNLAQAPDNASRTKILDKPDPMHLLGSDLRGTNVYGTNDEKIGDISDIVIDRQGRVVAVIVGVGGFLGLGQKDVAVPFSALELRAEKNGRSGTATTGSGTMDVQRVVLKGMTKADLEAAPSYTSGNRNNRK